MLLIRSSSLCNLLERCADFLLQKIGIMKHTSAFLSLLVLSMSSLSIAFQFEVGGDKGWISPTDNNTDAYNNWARQTRFQVGDTVYFKYVNDSVLVVDEAQYNSCNVSNPISKHADGKTVIELDHHGIFYFISGNVEHCKAGQRLIIDVIADHFDDDAQPPSSTAPVSAPGTGAASGPSGAEGHVGGSSMPKSGAAKSTVSSAVLGFMVVVYMFL